MTDISLVRYAQSLEVEIDRLRAALRRIANLDYRGNKHTSQAIAEEALGSLSPHSSALRSPGDGR